MVRQHHGRPLVPAFPSLSPSPSLFSPPSSNPSVQKRLYSMHNHARCVVAPTRSSSSPPSSLSLSACSSDLGLQHALSSTPVPIPIPTTTRRRRRGMVRRCLSFTLSPPSPSPWSLTLRHDDDDGDSSTTTRQRQRYHHISLPLPLRIRGTRRLDDAPRQDDDGDAIDDAVTTSHTLSLCAHAGHAVSTTSTTPPPPSPSRSAHTRDMPSR